LVLKTFLIIVFSLAHIRCPDHSSLFTFMILIKSVLGYWNMQLSQNISVSLLDNLRVIQAKTGSSFRYLKWLSD
jgi:hypothetical protein